MAEEVSVPPGTEVLIEAQADMHGRPVTRVSINRNGGRWPSLDQGEYWAIPAGQTLTIRIAEEPA